MAESGMQDVVGETLWLCSRHAKHLRWTLQEIAHLFPVEPGALDKLTPVEEAFIGQFSQSLNRLEDAMEETLFAQVLELSDFSPNLEILTERLERLEEIGVINSSDRWMSYREMLSAFTQDYLQDSVLSAINLNKAEQMAGELLNTLEQIRQFALNHGVVETRDEDDF